MRSPQVHQIHTGKQLPARNTSETGPPPSCTAGVPSSRCHRCNCTSYSSHQSVDPLGQPLPKTKHGWEHGERVGPVHCGQPQAGSVGLRNPHTELPGDPHALFRESEQGLKPTPVPHVHGSTSHSGQEVGASVWSHELIGKRWSVHTVGRSLRSLRKGGRPERPQHGRAWGQRSVQQASHRTHTGDSTDEVPGGVTVRDGSGMATPRGRGLIFGKRKVLGMVVTAAHLHVCLMPELCTWTQMSQ